MAAGSTYTPIATTTGSGSSSSVTFSSIPSTYTDLVLIVNGATTTSTGNPRLRFNGDTGSNYSDTNIFGSGPTAGSYRNSNGTSIQAIATVYFNTTYNTNLIINIMNYANSTTYKTVLSRASKALEGCDAVVGLWRSTAAIDSLTFFTASGLNISSTSTFTLYGIAAA
jgi:hypothetical protein